MCILFIYCGSKDVESDYSLILISNRDEFYDRPTQNMAPWQEDPNIIGGRDLEANNEKGTWLAVSPLRNKMGVLLNIPGNHKNNAKSRGKIVSEYLKNEKPIQEYIDDVKSYEEDCNNFLFVSVEFGFVTPLIHTYTNVTKELTRCTETCMGFGNNLPHEPLTKVEAGKQQLKSTCERLNKIHMKEKLIEELTDILKSTERHLPDRQLETRRPDMYQQLSSMYVCIPEGRYGTRTHTLLLMTKSGHIDLIELTMSAPMDPLNPKWEETQFKFDI